MEILKAGWRAQHERDVEAWNEHIQQQQEEEDERRREQEQANPPADEQPIEEEAPKWVNLPTPSFLDIKPAQHVLKQLEKEFVELWHSTAEGCQEAAASDITSSNNTFSLVNTKKGLFLQTIGASSTSSKVTKDEDLSWNQFTEAKTRMIGCLKDCGWNEHEISQLAIFYLSLDVHPICSRPYGLEMVMRYQDRVRRDWVAHLRTGNPYSIAKVNGDLMKEYQDDIRNEAQARNNVRVSNCDTCLLHSADLTE